MATLMIGDLKSKVLVHLKEVCNEKSINDHFIFDELFVFRFLEELKKDKKGYEKLMSEINSMQVELDPGADYTIVGKYKIRKMGKKFVGVFNNIHKPLAIFDLSLNQLSFAEIILGYLIERLFKEQKYLLQRKVKIKMDEWKKERNPS